MSDSNLPPLKRDFFPHYLFAVDFWHYNPRSENSFFCQNSDLFSANIYVCGVLLLLLPPLLLQFTHKHMTFGANQLFFARSTCKALHNILCQTTTATASIFVEWQQQLRTLKWHYTSSVYYTLWRLFYYLGCMRKYKHMARLTCHVVVLNSHTQTRECDTYTRTHCHKLSLALYSLTLSLSSMCHDVDFRKLNITSIVEIRTTEHYTQTHRYLYVRLCGFLFTTFVHQYKCVRNEFQFIFHSKMVQLKYPSNGCYDKSPIDRIQFNSIECVLFLFLSMFAWIRRRWPKKGK